MAGALFLAAVCVAPAGAAAKGRDLPKGLTREIVKPRIEANLAEALEQIGKYAETPVQADWAVLGAIGVTQETKVVMKAPRATPAQLLDLVIAQVSPRGKPLGWFARDGVVHVTTQMRALRRGRSLPAAPPETPSRRPRFGVRSLDFEEVELAEVIKFLRTVSGLNMHVNWQAMQLSGVDKTTPITVKATGISIGRALDLVTDHVSGNKDKFERIYWVVDRGVVMISTGTSLNTHTRTRVYDVAHILMAVPNFRGPRLSTALPSQDRGSSSSSRSGSSSGRGDGGLFQDDQGTTDRRDEGDDRQAQKKANRETLVQIIKEMIGDDMWYPQGKGSVRTFGNQLIITQTLLGFKLLDRAIPY
jgi:hypothetical protein